ncbi:hypothetical protein GIY56_15420 [Paracoccus sp. YIM 132242]|uniref:Uncharacterized protein n=1 Tax=Paracoccus lichenicola TaxID=2665644 RepID=A0A6L6HWH4_9RHOB|nr:hypothetical protein [Paracoccus lichenicola]MTE01678.1 hypothetical protein [Paracoccus lichenicola]
MPVIAYNDADIVDRDVLIRRINPAEHVVPDGNGGQRLSTKAISSSSTAPYGMSVDAMQLMEIANIDVREFVTCPKYVASVQFSAGVARSAGLLVGYHPLEKDGDAPANPYHAEVWSHPDPSRDFSKRQKKDILNTCEWFVALDGVSIPRKNA